MSKTSVVLMVISVTSSLNPRISVYEVVHEIVLAGVHYCTNTTVTYVSYDCKVKGQPSRDISSDSNVGWFRVQGRHKTKSCKRQQILYYGLYPFKPFFSLNKEFQYLRLFKFHLSDVDHSRKNDYP